MSTKQWLAEHGAQVRAIDRIKTSEHSLEEVAIDLMIDRERRELPVAIAAERTREGRSTAIRIYHRMWPPGHESSQTTVRRFIE